MAKNLLLVKKGGRRKFSLILDTNFMNLCRSAHTSWLLHYFTLFTAFKNERGAKN